MHLTRTLLAQRQPLIRFLGKRSTPSKIDHTPQPHPVSGTSSLPSSFAAYRQNASQHGPLSAPPSTGRGGRIGGSTGAGLGPVEAEAGTFFDVSELPARFRRRPMTGAEIEAVGSGGASAFA